MNVSGIIHYSYEIPYDRTIVEGVKELLQIYQEFEKSPDLRNLIKYKKKITFGNRVMKLTVDRSLKHVFKANGIPLWKECTYKFTETNHEVAYIRFSIKNVGVDEFSFFQYTLQKLGVDAPIIGKKIDSFYDGFEKRFVICKDGEFSDGTCNQNRMDDFRGIIYTKRFTIDCFKVAKILQIHSLSVLASNPSFLKGIRFKTKPAPFLSEKCLKIISDRQGNRLKDCSKTIQALVLHQFQTTKQKKENKFQFLDLATC